MLDRVVQLVQCSDQSSPEDPTPPPLPGLRKVCSKPFRRSDAPAVFPQSGKASPVDCRGRDV